MSKARCKTAVLISGSGTNLQAFIDTVSNRARRQVLIEATVVEVTLNDDFHLETDEHAEVGDRLDGPDDVIALVAVGGEVLPWIRDALLDAERDSATLLVNVVQLGLADDNDAVRDEACGLADEIATQNQGSPYALFSSMPGTWTRIPSLAIFAGEIGFSTEPSTWELTSIS